MTHTDYYTIRIPRCVGWRTLTVNALFVLVGAALIFAGRHDMGGALCLAGLVNIVLRLCARTPVADRANVLAAIWSPKRADPPAMHGLVAQVDAVRSVACAPTRDAVLITELATMLDDQRHLTSRPAFAGAQTRLEAAAARMATAPRMNGYRASTVSCAFLVAMCASFAVTFAAMVA